MTCIETEIAYPGEYTINGLTFIYDHWVQISQHGYAMVIYEANQPHVLVEHDTIESENGTKTLHIGQVLQLSDTVVAFWVTVCDIEQCQDLWWFDKTHPHCSQGEFCGTYMYDGLKTFATQIECEAALETKKPIALLLLGACGLVGAILALG
jgi:hypothetical protein